MLGLQLLQLWSYWRKPNRWGVGEGELIPLPWPRLGLKVVQILLRSLQFFTIKFPEY